MVARELGDETIGSRGLRLGSIGLSEAAFTCGIAFLIFGCLGYVVYAVVPGEGSDAVYRTVQSLLTEISNIRSKPKEKFTFLTLTVLSPLLVAAAVAIQRRVYRTGGETAAVILSSASAALLWRAIRSGRRRSFRRPPRP